MFTSHPPPSRPPRLLIVDADDARRRLHEKLFMAEGYVVDTLSSGDDLLANIRDYPPDLIIMDVSLPGTSGFELCTDLRMQDETQLTSIMLFTSSRTDEQDVVRGLLCGADDYLVTPNRLQELRARARVQLRNHRDRERLRWAKQQRSRFRTEALLDPLTGISNRRAAEEAVSGALRTVEPLILMLLDIDHFKAVNDNYGHPTGDKVLRAFANGLDQIARRGDVVARYGGEEFLVLIQGTAPELAKSIAERFRSAISRREMVEIHGNLTVSIGITTWDGMGDAPSADNLIATADAALYQAKNAGRDRVCAKECPIEVTSE